MTWMAAFERCNDLIQYNQKVLISSPGLPTLVPAWVGPSFWMHSGGGGGGASLRSWRGLTLASEPGAQIIEAAFGPGPQWFVQILANWISHHGTCSPQRQLKRKCERKLSGRGMCDVSFNLLRGPATGRTFRILCEFLFSGWEILWIHQRSQTWKQSQATRVTWRWHEKYEIWDGDVCVGFARVKNLIHKRA